MEPGAGRDCLSEPCPDTFEDGLRSSRVVAFGGSKTVRQTLSALSPENNITR